MLHRVGEPDREGIDQHTEGTTFCIDDSGRLRVDAHHNHQKIGALNPSAAMTCNPNILVASGASETQLSCSLSLTVGPAQLAATLNGTTHPY